MMQVGPAVVVCWQSEGPFVIEYASLESCPTSLHEKKKKKNLHEQKCTCKYSITWFNIISI